MYVVDCSDSMWGRFHEVREELLGSIEQLSGTIQVCVLFYRDELVYFENGRPSTGGDRPRPHWVKNNAADLRRMRQFIESIVPGGGTDHLPAVLAAIAMDPDVIYLLTDASDPVLTAAELRKIRTANRRGTVIHTINFESYEPEEDNFLELLARQNDGRYEATPPAARSRRR